MHHCLEKQKEADLAVQGQRSGINVWPVCGFRMVRMICDDDLLI